MKDMDEPIKENDIYTCPKCGTKKIITTALNRNCFAKAELGWLSEDQTGEMAHENY